MRKTSLYPTLNTSFVEEAQNVFLYEYSLQYKFEFVRHNFYTSTGSVGFDFDGFLGVFLGVFRGCGEGVLKYKTKALDSRFRLANSAKELHFTLKISS